MPQQHDPNPRPPASDATVPDTSGPRRLLTAALALMVAAYLYPGLRLPLAAAMTLHIVGMAAITVLICLGLRTFRGRLLGVLGVYGVSAVLEGMQYLHPSRTGKPEDFLFNALGCLLGLGLFALLHGRFTLSGKRAAIPSILHSRTQP